MRIGIIDTETGGFDERKHGLTQIAVIDGMLYVEENRIAFGVRSTFHEFVSPDPTFEYEQEALDYQGVTLDFLRDNGANICSALTRLSLFMEPIVAAGPGRVWAQEDMFDWKFIDAGLKYDAEFGNNDPRVRGWVKPRSDWNCSKRLARLCRSVGLLAGDSDSLEPVCKVLGINRPTTWQNKPLQDCWMTGQAIAVLLTNLGMATHPYYMDR